MRGRAAGFTLIEVLIAVTLVGFLSLSIFIALRVGLNAEEKSNARLAADRRVMGAQRALEQQLNGFMPVNATWRNPNGGTQRFAFFEGLPQSMRFISSYSLRDAGRGFPQMLEYQVIPGDRGEGVRLIVNELPYRGGEAAGERIAGWERDENGNQRPVFLPIEHGAFSFVMADRLAYCRMSYLLHEEQPFPHDEWRAAWEKKNWPLAVRIEMGPLDTDGARLHPATVTAALHAFRDPEIEYVD